MTDDDQPKRRGRPPKSSSGPKVGTLTFRTRADFRDRLEQAAALSGRSVTEEVELRVERSFDVDRIVRRLDDMCSIFIDNGEMARVFISSLMANIASIQQTKSNDGRQIGNTDWSVSLATQAGVRAGTLSYLEHYAPEIDKETFNSLSDQEKEDIKHCRVLADIWAKMATGRANDLVAAVMRQNGAEE